MAGTLSGPNDTNGPSREAKPRHAQPDVGLSWQALAELVTTWVWDHHQERMEHSANLGVLDRTGQDPLAA